MAPVVKGTEVVFMSQAEQKKELGLEGYTAAFVPPWKLRGRTAIDFRN